MVAPSWEPEVVRGPIVPAGARVIYQVTLANGLVLTNPMEFGDPMAVGQQAQFVVSLDGRVLGEQEALTSVGPTT